MEAIVLARRDFREYDQIISLYSKEKGKQELLARGVKKIVSKNAAHLEPFSCVFAASVPGREINYLTNVQPVDAFARIRAHFEKSLAAQYVVSLIDRLVDVSVSDQKMFVLLKTWLDYVDKAPKMHELLIDGFVAKFFATLGFRPILDQCVLCSAPYQQIMKDFLAAGQQPGFYFAGGGLVCHACRAARQGADEKVLTCGLQEVSDLEVLIEKDWRTIYSFPLHTPERDHLHRLLYEYALFHSERRIVNWRETYLVG